MKWFYIGLIAAGLLVFIWSLLSPLFGKIGKFVIGRKDKVKDDIENNEEDWY
ncbi:hypothetical protein [Paenilisteria weihenstephanensis]|uniref:hypothetical protein n=1 Tax=Listeria weihenstephanensis TaxID=1006155 RepID=UPI0004ACF178|nr:hypothetical protein [Listeria weihenstephanensis]